MNFRHLLFLRSIVSSKSVDKNFIHFVKFNFILTNAYFE
jgi:hypothetical protein